MRRSIRILASMILLLSLVRIAGGSTEVARKNEITFKVNLEKVVQGVVKRNATAINDYLKAKMSRERIKVEEGIFEPILQSSINRQRTDVPNSTEDILTRQQDEYAEDVVMFDAGLGGLLPTGANWDVKFVDRQRNSSTIEKFRDYRYEYDNLLKFSLTQPILKGFGREVSEAKINLAKVESEIDLKKFEQKLMELVGVTIQIYWRLYGAQKIYQSWEKSIEIVEDSLKDLKLRAMSGKVPQTELMEAQSTISIRKGELYSAKSKVVEAQTQLMTLLNISISDNENARIVAADDPFGNYNKVLKSTEYLEKALESWPEYKIAKKTVEKERIQEKYARNELLPQVDFVGTTSISTLDQDHREALKDIASDEFLSWSLGIKFSMPLLGNARGKSSLLIASMRAKQAEIELDALMKSLSNLMHSKVDSLASLQDQLVEYKKGLDVRGQLLEIDQKRLKAGRISIKDLLRQEEEYVNYQRKVLSAVVNYKYAEATLDIAVGDILTKYGIDPNSLHYKDEVLPSRLESLFSD